jgi:hypothetical protein
MYKAGYFSQWNRLNVPFGDWYAMVRIDRVLLLHWDVLRPGKRLLMPTECVLVLCLHWI